MPLDLPWSGELRHGEVLGRLWLKFDVSGRGHFTDQGDNRPVITKTCTRCTEQQKEPLTWCSVAWVRTDGVRVAYKHKLGLECVATKIAPLQVHSDDQGMSCPSCGIDTSEDYDAVYVTWIPKGIGKLQAECPFCGPCAAVFRAWFQEGSAELENREPSSRGTDTAPRYTAAQTLAALGILPRA